MILLNFGHPLADEHLSQVEALAERAVERTVNVPARFDHAQSFTLQTKALVDGLALTPAEWKTLSVLMNPPALTAIAVTLLAELHGRMGRFPLILRIRPVIGSIPVQYEVAELIDLQVVRDLARGQRS